MLKEKELENYFSLFKNINNYIEKITELLFDDSNFYEFDITVNEVFVYYHENNGCGDWEYISKSFNKSYLFLSLEEIKNSEKKIAEEKKKKKELEEQRKNEEKTKQDKIKQEKIKHSELKELKRLKDKYENG